MEKADAKALERDWRAVGDYLNQAIIETVEAIGDDDLAERVVQAAEQGDTLPDPSALIILEAVQPGISEAIVTRAAEIQQAAHQQETKALKSLHSRARMLGRGIVRMASPWNP